MSQPSRLSGCSAMRRASFAVMAAGVSATTGSSTQVKLLSPAYRPAVPSSSTNNTTAAAIPATGSESGRVRSSGRMSSTAAPAARVPAISTKAIIILGSSWNFVRVDIAVVGRNHCRASPHDANSNQESAHKHQHGRDPHPGGSGFERRLEQDDVTVTLHHVVADLGVRLAGEQQLLDVAPQIRRQTHG